MTTRGHLLDGKTLALWRLNEANPLSNAKDESGVYPLTPSISIPSVSGLINDGGRARRFIQQSNLTSALGTTPTLDQVFNNYEITFECWIRLSPSWLPTTNIVGGYTGTLTPGFEVEVDANRSIRCVWGKIGGTQQIFTSPAGLIPINVPTHVAFRRTFEAGGLTTLGEVFVNGIKVSFTGTLSNPVVAGSNILMIGGPSAPIWANNWFNGTIDDVRISLAKRTDTEILASYRNGITDFVPVVQPAGLGHRLDSSTAALWRLDENSSSAPIVDIVGGISLNPTNIEMPVPSLIGDSGLAKLFNATNSYANPGNIALGTVLLGEWTIETWIRPDAIDPLNTGIDARIIDIQDVTKRYVWFSVNTAKKLEIFWQGVGNVQFDDTTTTLTLGTIYHVAARKVSLGGGNYRVDIYVNGVKVTSSGSLANSIASGAPTTVSIGSGVGGGPFIGTIDDLRISKVARTDAEIFESYRRGSSNQTRSIKAQGHILDSKTVSLWRMDKTPPIDLTSRVNLVQNTTGSFTSPTLVQSLIQDGGAAIQFFGSNNNMAWYSGNYLASDEQVRLLMEGTDATVEFWALFPNNLASPPSTIQRVITLFNNGHQSLGVRIEASKLELVQTTLNGTAFVSTIDSRVLLTGVRYHLAIRRRTNNAGKVITDTFVNGIRNVTSGLLDPPDNGSSFILVSPSIVISGNGGNIDPINGIIDDVRISYIARTDVEISESYWRGVLDQSNFSGFSLGALLD